MQVVVHRRRWVYLVRPALLVAVSLLAGRVLVSLVGSVDWGAVSSALSRLSWTSVPVLAALLLAREAFNSIPLAVFVPGLGLRRAFQNDLAAHLVGTVAPPPGDIVIRISMFRSWGISAGEGLPGVTLNSLTFYVIRFGVPVAGLLLLLGEDLAATQTWLAVGSFLIAVTVVAGLVLVSRGEALARRTGLLAGRMATRVRREIDPEAWADTVADFRDQMSSRLVRGLAPSLTALAAMVVTDGLILLLALRLVGVGAGQLSTVLVLGTFLVAYPLTALPLAGLGVLDAALLVALTEVAGPAAEPEIVAALVVWRVVTLVGTLALGAAALARWKWTTRVGPSGDGTSADGH